MKKLALLALAAIIVIGGIVFIHSNDDSLIEADGLYYDITIIDSCEYVLGNSRIAHKGNCKFCAERRKAELREIVELLKDK